MAITPAKTFRKKTEDKIEQRAKQAPGQVYGQVDASKRLGRKARTGIETDIAARTADLKFDVAGERTAREAELDRRAQESRERMARTFGLTSSGIQQGRAVRAFAGIEGERLKQQAALESEFSQRRGQERRANVQSLLQAQESREAADLRAREATGQDVDRQQRALDTGEQLEFQRGVATGEVDGTETEARRAAKEREKLEGEQLDLQEGVVKGEFEGSPTEAKRAAMKQETLQGRSVGVSERQMDLAELQEKTGRLRSAGLAVDPETGERLETLEAEIQRRQQTGAERQMSETERAALVAEEDRRATLTGIVPGDQDINPEAIREMFGLSPLMQQDDLAAEVAQYGFVRDPQTGLYTAPAAVTVEARMQAAQEYAVRKGVDIQADAQTAEAAAMKSKSAIDQAAISGKITLFDENGEPQRDRYGEPITLNTIAAEELLLREQEATGVIDGAETMENKKFQLQAEIERGQAFLREELQTANIAFREADITGTYSKMGATEAGQFYRAFAASKEGNEFNPRYDLNGDGEVNFGDFTEVSRIANGEPVTTLNGQKIQNDNASRLFGEKLEEAKVTGMIDGDFTVQELSRQFEEERVITDMFGGKPPTTFTEMDLDSDRFPYGKKRTDPDFRAELDFNSDGINNFDDFMIGAQQINSAKNFAADTERIAFLEAKKNEAIGFDPSGAKIFQNLTTEETAELANLNQRTSGSRTKLVEGTTGMYMYQPPGPQTLKAQQLGVTEKQFTEGVRQFNKNFGQQIADYKSRFSGYMVDEDGNPEWISKYNEDTKKTEWIQATRSERELFDKQMDKLDTLMQEGGMKQFAESMGLEWRPTNKLKREEQLALVQGAMSAIFNPVAPTSMAGGSLWGGAISAAGDIGAAIAQPD